MKDKIKKACDAYIEYSMACDEVAKEAQKYIDWDDSVSCEYFPSDGLCITATTFLGGMYDMPESVCSATIFFKEAELKGKLSEKDFKAICI